MPDKQLRVRFSTTGASSTKSQIKGVGRAGKSAGESIKASMLRAAVAVGALVASIIGTRGLLFALKKIIQTGAETEQAMIRLNAVFGKGGPAAFEAVRSAAAKLPFTFSEVLEGATFMAVAVSERGLDMEKTLLEVAEISARTGLGFREAATSFQRFALSGAAAADQFRERGINAMLGLMKGADMSAEASLAAWNRFFEGIDESGQRATEKLAESFDGSVSMLQDAMRSLWQAMADAGVLAFATRVVQKLTTWVRGFAAALRTDWGLAFEQLGFFLAAKLVEGFAKAAAKMGRAIDLRDNIPIIGKYFEELNLVVKMWEALGDVASDSAAKAAEALDILANAGTFTPPAPDEDTDTTIDPVTGKPKKGFKRPGRIGPSSFPTFAPARAAEQPGEFLLPIPSIDTEQLKAELFDKRLQKFSADAQKFMARAGVQIGASLIEGIISGADDMGERLKKFIIQLATRFILGPLTSFLGIGSPSRVTYGYGVNLVEGMINGIASMTGALSAQVNKVAAIASDGLQPGLPGVGAVLGAGGAPVSVSLALETPDSQQFPPWALEWLANANVKLRFQGAEV